MSYYVQTAYPQSNRFTSMLWRLPLSLAIALHFVTFALLVFPPTFFLPDRDLPEIQTINLFTIDEFQQKIQTPRPQPTKTPPKNNAQSIAIEPPAAQAPPAQIISLRPRRMKKKVTKKPEPKPAPPPKEETQRQKALERIQARVNQKVEDQKLKHDLSSLRSALHNSAKTKADTQETSTSTPDPGPSGPPSGGTNARINETQRRYFIAVHRKILDNWSLPKTQDWDNNLEAVIVIYIQKTGVISKTVFEKKSKNVYFNQYVEKAIQAAAPMPPIPSDLKKSSLEIGLRFRPSGLY